MAGKVGKSLGEADIHNIETRTAILETKYEYIEETLKESKGKLNSIDEKVDGITTHMAKQNGALPQLQSDMTKMLQRIDEYEKSDLDLQKNQIAIATKTKLLWGLVVSVGASVVLLSLKIILGL